jgi:hypothetical protein
VQAGLERESGVRPRGASKPVMVNFIKATWNFDELPKPAEFSGGVDALSRRRSS